MSNQNNLYSRSSIHTHDTAILALAYKNNMLAQAWHRDQLALIEANRRISELCEILSDLHKHYELELERLKFPFEKDRDFKHMQDHHEKIERFYEARLKHKAKMKRKEG